MSGRGWRRFHLCHLSVLLLLGIPTFWLWLHSVPWIVGMSWWALVVGELSAWQAARVEEKADGC